MTLSSQTFWIHFFSGCVLAQHLHLFRQPRQQGRVPKLGEFDQLEQLQRQQVLTQVVARLEHDDHVVGHSRRGSRDDDVGRTSDLILK